ncbi:uncharacterized protein A4U43_C03F20840 [Asparagus officinalis]|uniref:Uncharacterized protein n=1 Tax=Asparagus officinalis TaxID=4686 RepID=A0A5P1FDK0_ASPOF|nr:uncharacterized protein A4U43_C03F20840 [Asparagus officinalis]
MVAASTSRSGSWRDDSGRQPDMDPRAATVEECLSVVQAGFRVWALRERLRAGRGAWWGELRAEKRSVGSKLTLLLAPSTARAAAVEAGSPSVDVSCIWQSSGGYHGGPTRVTDSGWLETTAATGDRQPHLRA